MIIVRFTGALLLAVSLAAAAQDPYPSRPVRVLVPYAPGGATDIIARIVSAKLTESLGQSFVVENRTGANGNLALEAAAKATPDGYTLLVGNVSTNAINENIYREQLTIQPSRDLVGITKLVEIPHIVVASASFPANSIAELIAAAKKEPGKINFASAGNGTTNHLSGELFKSRANIDIVHVPYRGAGPAMNDIVGGHVQMFFDLMPVVLPQIATGKVRALANAGAKRPSALPDVPTIAEQGLAGFDASSWYGLVAPARTPEPVLAKLRDEVAKALKAPDMIARIHELGSEPGTVFGSDFGAFMAAETRKWADVIRTSGAKAD